MKLEIERKFLLLNEDFKDEANSFHRIAQGYLSSHPNRTVRVRIKENLAYLTIKGASTASGTSRFEWEREIPLKEAEALLELCESGRIDKIRYEIKYGNHLFEVDEFGGDNQGLLLAEVELMHEDEDFAKPGWLGKEVTGEARYYNSTLSNHPFNSWEKLSS